MCRCPVGADALARVLCPARGSPTRAGEGRNIAIPAACWVEVAACAQAYLNKGARCDFVPTLRLVGATAPFAPGFSATSAATSCAFASIHCKIVAEASAKRSQETTLNL